MSEEELRALTEQTGFVFLGEGTTGSDPMTSPLDIGPSTIAAPGQPAGVLQPVKRRRAKKTAPEAEEGDTPAAGPAQAKSAPRKKRVAGAEEGDTPAAGTTS